MENVEEKHIGLIIQLLYTILMRRDQLQPKNQNSFGSWRTININETNIVNIGLYKACCYIFILDTYY